MLRLNFKLLIAVCALSAGVSLSSCKSKPKDTDNSAATIDTAAAPAAIAPAPVEIAADDALTTGVKDATQSYPGVKAAVNNGEITLTGEIQRSKLADLMMSLNSLKPKKINNQLTIK